MARGTLTPVYLEVGQKRVFACALDWPGWCRAGKTEQAALDALADYAERYADVAAEARLKPPIGQFEVIERVPGDASTDFGVPGAILERDHAPLDASESKRLARLVSAAWSVFDRVVKGAPAALRKGPRGGGRDRDKIVAHVLGGEVGYARQLGLRIGEPDPADAGAVGAHREAIIAALGRGEGRWPARYGARRIAWHVLDHAWEIQDRSE